MFRKTVFYLAILGTFSLIFIPVRIGATMTSTNYIIWADVFNSGGTEEGTSTNYALQDSIGEPVIASTPTPTSTSGYLMKLGFREMYPDSYITFSLSATSIDLGTLSSSAAKTASHTMTADSNSTLGYTITVAGSTLTSGANTITAIGATPAASLPGSEQFGINLVANTSPAVGANTSGSAPIGSAANSYNTANYFAFNSGDTVATSTVQVNQTIYTVSYLANITSATEAGTYTTSLTYSATVNY